MTITGATIASNGIIYFAGGPITLNNAKFTHTGSLVAAFFLPQTSSVVSLTGDSASSSSAAGSARKAVGSAAILAN